MTKEIKQTKDIQTVIDELAIKGVEALNEMADFTQEQVDHIVHQAAIAALDKHMYLAKLAVDETGRGIYEDKAIKNMYASEYIWNSIKYDRTVGVIAEDKEQGLVSIAEPVGVICGVTPTTNPTSTTIFKALIALLRLVTLSSLPSTHQLKNHLQRQLVSFVMQLLKQVHLRTASSGLKSPLSKQLVF